MSGEMERKRITLSVGPSVFLLVGVLLAGFFLVSSLEKKKKKELTIDNTALITTRIRDLGELTTACYYDEIVLTGSKKNAFSESTLGSLVRDGFGKDVDDHLAIIAKGTVRAGIDLRKMETESVRFSGDTAILRLPSPEYLDVIVNPSDFEVFAESGRWGQGEVSRLQDKARERLISEADYVGLKRTAYEGAMEAISDLLKACGVSYIRFDHPAFYFPMPGTEALYKR